MLAKRKSQYILWFKKIVAETTPVSVHTAEEISLTSTYTIKRSLVLIYANNMGGPWKYYAK